MSIRHHGANEGEDRKQRNGMQQRCIRKRKFGRVVGRFLRQEKDKDGEEYANGEAGTVNGRPYRVIILPSPAGDMAWIGQRENIERSCPSISGQ